jgi:dienelactone hydrolase
MLAEAGYLAMSIDMYGDGKVAVHPDQAGAFSSAAMADLEEAEKRFNAAMRVLNEHPLMQKNKMAAIGYCFGGGVVLHMARVGTDLKGVASFHGSLAGKVEAQKDQVKAQVLVLHGTDDTFVSQEDVSAFEKEMKRANAVFEVVQYPGATHSFTNPEADELSKRFRLPLAYNREADEKSWQSLKAFLVRVFQ